jgi:hypothetical protein
MNIGKKRKIGILVLAGLAWSTTACGGAEPMDTAGADSSAETGAVVLAKLEIGESTVSFEQLGDGSIAILEGAPPNAPRLIADERMNLSPAELFRLLAPEMAVPNALVEYDLAEQAASAAPVDAANGDTVGSPHSDLAGKSASFIANYCGFCGADHSGCVTNVAGGSWYYPGAHRGGTYFQEEIGDGFTFIEKQNGKLIGTWNLAAGTVWHLSRHFNHWLSIPLGLDLYWSFSNYTVLHTSAWFTERDQFISGPGCH